MMTTDEVLEAVRRLTRDTEADYINTDDEVYAAIATAQDTMAVETEVLQRDVPVTYLATATSVALPEFILRPLRVKYMNKIYDVLNIDRALGYPPPKFSHDLGNLYMDPIPQVDTPINVKAVTLPEHQPSESNQVLEIPERLHYALAVGASVILMRMLDADTEDYKRLAMLEAEWSKHLLEARRYAALHNRTQKPIRYGGL